MKRTPPSPNDVLRVPVHRTLERRLATVANRLGEDELAALLLIAERVAKGETPYGRLDVARDRRDFSREALEEVADALFYIAADLIRCGGGRRRAAGSGPEGSTR